jgi:hypothetical protein
MDPSRRVRCDWVSTPEVFLVERHLVSFQDAEILLLKCMRTMMLGLVLNITNRLGQLRNSDAKCPIPLLPREVPQFRERLVNPN